MIRNILLALVVGLSLTACHKLPHDQKVETLVTEHVLTSGFEDLFIVENFAKINGFQPSDNTYIVDVEYDLVFQKSFMDVVEEIGKNPTGPQYGVFGARFILAAIESNFGQFEVGDRISKKEKVTLIRTTEKGWQVAE